MRLLIWLILAYLGYKIVKGYLAGKEKPSPATTDTETHQDPVCGVYVAADDAVVGRLDDKRIYFCSMNCLEKYRESLMSKEN
jgi:YHS domain-containing protein